MCFAEGRAATEKRQESTKGPGDWRVDRIREAQNRKSRGVRKKEKKNRFNDYPPPPIGI
jgi:hypothetical protein